MTILNQLATISSKISLGLPSSSVFRGGYDHASCGPRAQDPGQAVEDSAPNCGLLKVRGPSKNLYSRFQSGYSYVATVCYIYIYTHMYIYIYASILIVNQFARPSICWSPNWWSWKKVENQLVGLPCDQYSWLVLTDPLVLTHTEYSYRWTNTTYVAHVTNIVDITICCY